MTSRLFSSSTSTVLEMTSIVENTAEEVLHAHMISLRVRFDLIYILYGTLVLSASTFVIRDAFVRLRVDSFPVCNTSTTQSPIYFTRTYPSEREYFSNHVYQ